ncbi:MAG: CCA tRNA nucleotidyltransferase [Paracoccaceae bacterium]
MRISGDWITRKGTQSLMKALEDAGHQAYFVGGCVRNALLDVPVADVDIATDAKPTRVMALAKAAKMKPIATGIDHGTVTVVSGGAVHEVTTFRKDVETDGRHAVVAFATDVADDAHRRDLTMNALYARADGTVIDPLGGLADLTARRVRFIDDADARIREDYLRILRFFRFHAWYGDPAEGMDTTAIAAIAANLDGLDTLSRERVAAETLKLLAAPDPGPAVAAMAQTGVLTRILPGADCRALAPLVHLEDGHKPDPIRRLAVLGGHDIESHLRLSNSDARRLAVLQQEIGSDKRISVLAYRYGAETAIDIALLRAASFGTPMDPNAQLQANKGASATLPVKAADLMPTLQGAALGARLKEIEARWIASDFTLTRAQLLN